MSITPEQKAANDQLEEAVHAVIKAYGSIPDGYNVTDYMVIGDAIGFHGEDDSDTAIFLLFRNGQMRATVGTGLFDLGYEKWKTQIDPPGDDDE